MIFFNISKQLQVRFRMNYMNKIAFDNIEIIFIKLKPNLTIKLKTNVRILDLILDKFNS